MSKFEVYCTNCGCQMKLRKGKFGDFWGCTGYPVCRQTMNTRDVQLQADNHEVVEPFNWKD